MVSIRRVFPLSLTLQNLEFPLVVSNTALQAYRGGRYEDGGVGGKLIGHLNTRLTKLCYVNFVSFQAPALHSGRASPILHACCCASCPNLPLPAVEQRTG